jgi:hypothetical protein
MENVFMRAGMMGMIEGQGQLYHAKAEFLALINSVMTMMAREPMVP